MATGRRQSAGAGTQNSGFIFGGIATATNANTSCTEEYDGTVWSTSGPLMTARSRLAGAGTQNTGLAMGGYPNTALTEEYNGFLWSGAESLPVMVNENPGAAGSQDSTFLAGGIQSGANSGNTYEYTKVFTIVDKIL